MQTRSTVMVLALPGPIGPEERHHEVPNEDALLGQALDQDALAQIHDAYYAPTYRYISFRADDLKIVRGPTSAVFGRLLAALRKRLGQPKSIRPWLQGTAPRVVKAYYRRQRRQNVVALDECMAAE